MTVVVHGRAGNSLADAGERYGAATARRGRFFEGQVAWALTRWLEARSDAVHLFHDLSGFHAVAGAGLKPLDLGSTNIDHVVLSGDMWLMIDANGCGAGTLRLDEAGRGVLVQADGGIKPQPWMDTQVAYASAGALCRLTDGKPGFMVWVVPNETHHGPDGLKAAFLRRTGCLVNLSDVAAGALDQVLPLPQPTALHTDVDELRGHLSLP